jgi:hypothetical protein
VFRCRREDGKEFAVTLVDDMNRGAGALLICFSWVNPLLVLGRILTKVGD